MLLAGCALVPTVAEAGAHGSALAARGSVEQVYATMSVTAGLPPCPGLRGELCRTYLPLVDRAGWSSGLIAAITRPVARRPRCRLRASSVCRSESS